jgi:hypothetical protein
MTGGMVLFDIPFDKTTEHDLQHLIAVGASESVRGRGRRVSRQLASGHTHEYGRDLAERRCTRVGWHLRRRRDRHMERAYGDLRNYLVVDRTQHHAPVQPCARPQDHAGHHRYRCRAPVSVDVNPFDKVKVNGAAMPSAFLVPCLQLISQLPRAAGLGARPAYPANANATPAANFALTTMPLW